MPGCLGQRSLARACSMASYIDHVIPWRDLPLFFLSVSSKVWSTCLVARLTASRLCLTRPVPRRLRVMKLPFQPHQIPLLRHPLARRPRLSQSQRRLCLRPSPRLFNSRFLRCWRPFGRTERQTLLPAACQAIPARPLSRPACRRLIHRLQLRVVRRLQQVA